MKNIPIPINEETTNKCIDLFDESTKETRKEIDENAAKGIKKLGQLIWASPLGRSIDLYIAERPYKMEKALEEMQQKYEKIPIQYRVEPSSYIALKGTYELNYALEEEQLKEMFQNILVSDMDLRKKDRVLPSYLEIIKQLSKNDALFLKKLIEVKIDKYFAIEMRTSENLKKGYRKLDRFLNYEKSGNIEVIMLNNIVIDNLKRLNIVELQFQEFIVDEEKYNDMFEVAKRSYDNFDQNKLMYEKGFLKFTDYGKNFVDICIK